MRSYRCLSLFMLACMLLAGHATAQFEDPFAGTYGGTFSRDGRPEQSVNALVIPDGEGYRVLVEPNWTNIGGDAFGRLPFVLELRGTPRGGGLAIEGRSLGQNWNGSLREDTLTIAGDSQYGNRMTLARVHHHSPTLGQQPPDGAVVLFPYLEGKPTVLDAWENAGWDVLEDGSVQVARGDNRTRRTFGDFHLHAEFMLPVMPDKTGQDRGNSGVYLCERYEVQILDSFGVLPGSGDCGALYRVSAPRVNASLPPGTWQTYDIEFRAPRLNDDGTVKEPARVTVLHNGVLVQDDVALERGTGSRAALPNLERGAIVLQDHGNPIRFRNMWLVER